MKNLLSCSNAVLNEALWAVGMILANILVLLSWVFEHATAFASDLQSSSGTPDPGMKFRGNEN